MRWWNTGSSQEAGSVLHNPVIKYNLGNFGEVFDEQFEAQLKSLGWVLNPSELLMKLRQSHGHAVRAHHCKMASVITSLFSKAVDPRTNFVKDKVFRVKFGAQILSDDHAVMKHLMTQPFVKGASPCVDAWLVDTL